MIKLANEYVDIKNIKHNVEHIILSEKDNISKDRILEEILLALVRKPKKVTDLV